MDSPQDTYARHLLSRRGYPLWMPEPSLTLPDVYRQGGLKIGDVGVVVPEDGSFDVLFNICLPQTHALHQQRGVPDNFAPVLLTDQDIIVIPEAESAGRIISTSSVARIGRQSSNDDPARPTQPGPLDYEFTLSTREGALLILPEGAERYHLRNQRPFLQEAIQHAVDWYNFAEDRLGRIISHDSLYLITGFHKACSWSLASYQHASGTGCCNAQFKAAQVGSGNISRNYTWETTQSLDWRVGPSEHYYNGIPNQSVFIQGFKIAVRSSILGTKWIKVKEDAPSVRPHRATFYNSVRRPSNARSPSSRSSAPVANTSRAVDADLCPDTVERRFDSDSSALDDGDDNDEEDDITIQHIPQVQNPFHPSDIINEYLLRSYPSATVAITHDTQWTTLLEQELLTPEKIVQEGCLEALACSMSPLSQEGAVYLENVAAENDFESKLSHDETVVEHETLPDLTKKYTSSMMFRSDNKDRSRVKISPAQPEHGGEDMIEKLRLASICQTLTLPDASFLSSMLPEYGNGDMALGQLLIQLPVSSEDHHGPWARRAYSLSSFLPAKIGTYSNDSSGPALIPTLVSAGMVADWLNTLYGQLDDHSIPFRGRRMKLPSMVFKSGSGVNTSRILDASTRQDMAGSFQKHSSSVYSVTYSPVLSDSTWIFANLLHLLLVHRPLWTDFLISRQPLCTIIETICDIKVIHEGRPSAIITEIIPGETTDDQSCSTGEQSSFPGPHVASAGPGLQIVNHKESPIVLSEIELATNAATQHFSILRPGIREKIFGFVVSCKGYYPLHVPALTKTSEMNQQLKILRPGPDSAWENLYPASRRQATGKEDMAYSLFGIVGVALPVAYGEGNLTIGLLEHILTRSADVSIVAWTGHPGSHHSCLPACQAVYSEIVPLYVPVPIKTSDMNQMSSLRSSFFDLSFVDVPYQRLYELPRFSLVGDHPSLPGILLQLDELAHSDAESNLREYRPTMPLLGDVEIQTTSDFSEMSNPRLIHPWINPLINRDFSRGEALFDMPTRALRLLVRLRQPLGGLLLSRSGREQRRWVATDNLIMVRVREEAPLSELMDAVCTVNIQ